VSILSTDQKQRLLKYLALPLIGYLLFYSQIEPLDENLDWGIASSTSRLGWVVVALLALGVFYYALARPRESLGGLEQGLLRHSYVFVLVLSLLLIHVIVHFPPLDFYQQDAANQTWFDEGIHVFAGFVIFLVIYHLPRAKGRRLWFVPLSLLLAAFVFYEFIEYMVWGAQTGWDTTQVAPESLSIADTGSDLFFNLLGAGIAYYFLRRKAP